MIGQLPLTSALYSMYKPSRSSFSIADVLNREDNNLLLHNTLLSSLSGQNQSYNDGGSDNMLVEFVTEYVPNNTLILNDIYAVEALHNMLSDELPSTFSVINAYQYSAVQVQHNLGQTAEYSLSLLL